MKLGMYGILQERESQCGQYKKKNANGGGGDNSVPIG
jgi:hypothetical protein